MKAFQYPCYSKSWDGYLNLSFSLLAIHKHFCTFLINDHVHIMDIAYKPVYNEAYLFKPLVYVMNSF